MNRKKKKNAEIVQVLDHQKTPKHAKLGIILLFEVVNDHVCWYKAPFHDFGIDSISLREEAKHAISHLLVAQNLNFSAF